MNRLRIGRNWLYIPLVAMAIFYLIPMYVMIVTGFKSFAEVDLQTMWNLPKGIHFDNYIEAFRQLAPSLWNSFIMVIPAAVISSFLGSLNGFILAKWKFRGADFIFPFILFGMFIPYQSILIPLVIFINNTLRYIGMTGIPALILAHIIYGIPITTLTFRNYYASIPQELLEAAKIDGADMLGIYRHILLPISSPQFCGGADLAVHLRLERLPVRGGANGQPVVAHHGRIEQHGRQSDHFVERADGGFAPGRPAHPCWSTFSSDVTSCAVCWLVR
jgi:glucose/mannose transport system permease protein